MKKIALLGNPNCGKTTIFNQLAGMHRHVGNYSGVTVEAYESKIQLGKQQVVLVDLPGVYGLTGGSPEEKVVLESVLSGEIDFIVNVVDATHLERHLYLTTQILSLGIPMILVLNMVDEARELHIRIDSALLEKLLDIPCVATIGNSHWSVEKLKRKMVDFVGEQKVAKPLHYGAEIETLLDKVAGRLEKDFVEEKYRRFSSIKLLEQSENFIDILVRKPSVETIAYANGLLRDQALHEGINPSVLMTHKRYGLVGGIVMEAVDRESEKENEFSRLLDRITTHRFLGLPIFLALMYAVFYLVFDLGDPMMSAIESGISMLAHKVSTVFDIYAVGEMWRSLVLDGIIGGVGGVLVFLPNIVLLFLAISILEGTGYMARAAFIMDRVMHKFGLHGKSFIPMLIGFGCSVPAIMATRTIESKRDRLVTMLVIPLMSCGGRFPIYALIIPIFFAESWQGAMMWLIYMIGILLAVVCARILKSTLFRGDDELFVMELPPYRIPTLRSILIHMFERSWQYVKKAGTVILLASIVMWYMNNYPKIEEMQDKQAQATLQAQESYSGHIGSALSVVLEPIGFDWQISSALVGAFAAKELFVSQLSILFSAEDLEDDEPYNLRAEIKKRYSPLQGFCIMLFCLISIPCVATIVVCAKESGYWTLAIAQMVGLTLLAWGATFVVYQLGLLFF